jgi:uncharacterized protein YcbK (DUF882 family)
MSEPDWSQYPNFSRQEFVCKCGCDHADMRPELVELLQALRTELDRPLPISSGFRCPAHNTAVSSSGPDGPHTTGAAVDVAVDRADAYALLKAALERGVPRVGIAQNGAGRFLHLDLLQAHETDLSPTIWSY